MNVGVFLCLEPYTSLENNLRLAHEYGFTHADITDTHSGGSMFASAGLSASVSWMTIHTRCGGPSNGTA